MAIDRAQRLREVRRFLRVDLHEARAPVLLAKLPGGWILKVILRIGGGDT